jgi:hypothetical protein
MPNTMTQFAATLLDLGLATADTLRPCTPEEVDEVRADQGVAQLPTQYEEFLLAMGRQAGELLRGTDFFYASILGLPKDGRELLADNDASHLLPRDALVVGMHQGYELYWLSPSGELSWCKKGRQDVHRVWPTLLDFLEQQARPKRSCGRPAFLDLFRPAAAMP